MPDSSTPLQFTGERFTPECVREIWYEHWHRYALAARFAGGRRVLDAACGEGYGSALLARHAASVLGVDISPEAIAHARSRYGNAANLRFEQGDATALDQLATGSFDLVVSFETIEHVAQQERLLAGFARVLAPDGVLIVSSPDKHAYSEVAGFRNEHHVRELYRDELEALLAPHFPARRLFGQKLLFQSAIWPLDGNGERIVADTMNQSAPHPQPKLAYAPLYFIAFCARHEGALPDVGGMVALFGDAEESVYAHYNHEVRRNMQAGTILAEMQQRVGAAEAALAAAPAPQTFADRIRRWLGGGRG